MEKIIFAGGCFWCIEAVFKRLKGVSTVRSGYTGGQVKNPTYEQVCSGKTGHAEAVEVSFDPSIISLETLLDVFFTVHDPTTLNQQGNDIGTQYRSAIFYDTDSQREIIEQAIATLENSDRFDDPIVTEVLPAEPFYEAEKYHQDYYDSNRSNGYCRLVIDPKIQKLSKDFSDKLTDGEEN